MFSGLDRTALADFQKIVAPFTDQLRSAPEADTASEDLRNDMRLRCSVALSVESGGWPVDTLFRLRKVIETGFYLVRASYNEWQILREVEEALSKSRRIRPFSDKASWQTALAAAVEALNHSSFRHSMLEGSREQIVAGAFMALKRKGYAYTLDGWGALLTQTSFRSLCAKIEDKIKRVGGMYTANATLHLMQRLGRIEDGSLLHARTPIMIK